MNKKILTVTLNPAVDAFVARSRLESVSAGGKGINVSRALHSLGVRAMATGILGGTAGELIEQFLEQENIASNFLWTDKETRTNITFKAASARNPKRIIQPGPRADKKVLDGFETRLKGLLRGCSFVVLCGSNAHGAPHDYYARLIRMIKRAGIPAALDTSSVELLKGLGAKPDLIKPNLEEAEFVLGRKLTSIEKLKSAVREFHCLGIKTVLLTLAGSGALGGQGGRIWHCRVRQLRGGHGVGCGDVFLAGFLAANLRRYNFPDALRFACSCATINYRGRIPGKIDRSKVMALFETIKVKEVSCASQTQH